MHKFKLFFVSALLLIFTLLSGCESKEDERKRKDAAFDACMDSYLKTCTRACEKDPKFMYCASKHNSKVVGSGCISYMNSHSQLEQVSMCKREACPEDYEAIKACTQSTR